MKSTASPPQQNWNNWPDAEEVEIQLITDSPNINIVDGYHYSSLIQSGQQYITDSDPFEIEVLSELGLFDLKLKVNSINNDGSIYTKEFPIKVDVSLFQLGFPLTGINQVESSPLVLDLDSDGMVDLVFGVQHRGSSKLFDYDGFQLLICYNLQLFIKTDLISKLLLKNHKMIRWKIN